MKRLVLGSVASAVAAVVTAGIASDVDAGPLPYCNDLTITHVSERTVRVEALTTVPQGAEITGIKYYFGDGAMVPAGNGQAVEHNFAADYQEPNRQTVIQAAIDAKSNGQLVGYPVLSQVCTKYVRVNR